MTQELSWFNDTLSELCQRAAKASLPPALLIAGPKGIGKLVFARLFANKLLGLKDSFHPDYLELSPEEDKKNITVDQVRSLIHHLSQTAHGGGYKIVVIYPAESMNIAASNALLKTLEEPQGKTLIILCSHQPSRLVPTIISRCQRVKLQMPTRAEAEDFLNMHCEDGEMIKKTLDITGNRPLSALEIIQNDTIKFYEDCFDHLTEVVEHKKNPIALAEIWAKSDVEEYVNLMQVYLMKMIASPYNEKAINSPPQSLRDSSPRKGEQNIPPPFGGRCPEGAEGGMSRIFLLLDKITEAKRSLQSQSNPNKQLLLENLLMEFTWN